VVSFLVYSNGHAREFGYRNSEAVWTSDEDDEPEHLIESIEICIECGEAVDTSIPGDECPRCGVKM
jgi:hypothetical protein